MRILFVVLIIITCLPFAFYVYFEGLKTVNIRIAKQGGETLVYEEYTGDYRDISTVMDRVYYSLLMSEGIRTSKGFGIYYDNPREVQKCRLRSEAGCILEYADNEILEKLAGSYNIKLFPAKDFIVAEFPYKGKMSVIISTMKVYPALNKYVKENGFDENGWVMEIYDIPGRKIIYRKEIVKKEEEKGRRGEEERGRKEWALDLQNMTNRRNVFTRNWNSSRKEEVTSYQMGFMPMVTYRINF